MPFTIDDVAKYTKTAGTDALKRQWVAIANDILDNCPAGEDCDAQAIKMANGVIKQRVSEAALEDAELFDYQYNGVRCRATRRRSSTRDDKAWMRRVVYDGSSVLVHYADPDMPMRRNNPQARADFLARHDCKSKRRPQMPGFWACYDWQNVEEEMGVSMGNNFNEAEWTTAYINDLPDSSFALILPGGEKDEDGKTTPRSLRKLPYKNADGSVDVPHLRNALARVGQVEGASQAQIDKARAELERAAKEHLTTYEEQSMDVDMMLEFIGDAMAALTKLSDMLQAPEEEPMGDEEADDGESMHGDEMPDEDEASELAELGVPVVTLVEQESPANRRAPLELDVGIIKVGPGNERDNHYYSRELLERDGKAFEGLTMHVVDHDENRRSEQTDVSTVKEILGVRDLQDGAYLVARVGAYDPDFCEKTRNRADAGELGKLQCSILAKGEAVRGDVDGTEYNVVQKITEGRYVDWVTKAGAGGRALSLSEAAQDTGGSDESEEQDVQEVDIEESENALGLPAILAELGKTSLPAQSVTTLAAGDYADSAALQEAISKEVKRLKANGSGQPWAQPRKQQRQPKPTLAEIQEAQSKVNQKWLGGRDARTDK